MTNLTNYARSVAEGCVGVAKKVTRRVKTPLRRLKRKPHVYVPAMIALALGSTVMYTTVAIRNNPEAVPDIITTKAVKTEGQNTVEVTYPDGTVVRGRASIQYSVQAPRLCQDLIGDAY